MSKDKNNELDANELEAVSGGGAQGNQYMNDLLDGSRGLDPDDLEVTLASKWSGELLNKMISTYGEDKTTELVNKYKHPYKMFDA